MDSSVMGRKGGLKGSEAQHLARKRNILQALAKRHPQSVRISQQLRVIEMAEKTSKARE